MNQKKKKRSSPVIPCLLSAGLLLTAFSVGTKVETMQVIEKTDISCDAPKAVLLTFESEEQRVSTAAAEQRARVARYINIDMTAEEWNELAAILFLEAGNQCPEGQQAVVEVVFNRVRHSGFPNTVHDVLHEGEDSGRPQFSTIYQIGEATPTQAQYDAIDNALYGDTILDADVVFFSRNGENDRVWGQIGDHIFCREYVYLTVN